MTKFTEYLREEAAQSLAFAPSLIPKHAYSIAANQIEELLAALKAVISDCERIGSDGWMTGNVHGDEWKQACAAIRKAEGEES
jgi:hypothetical protein